jgi:hypothetical protein
LHGLCIPPHLSVGFREWNGFWRHIASAGSKTCDEVDVGLHMRHQMASARIRELVLGGRLRDTGHRRLTRSGRLAAVSAITW